MARPEGHQRRIDYAISSSAIRGDTSKLGRLTQLGFDQLELGFFDEYQLPRVMDFAAREGLQYGFHDPLPKPPDYSYPFLTDPDAAKRQRTLDSIRRSLDTATQYGAFYLIGHLPSVIFEPRPGLDPKEIFRLAQDSCARLAAWSEAAGIPIVLENVGPNPYFHRAEDFLKILRAYPPLKFCLDLGHLHLSAHHYDIDPLAFAELLSPHTAVIHVYNTTPQVFRTHHHVPAHPSLRPEEGWLDIPALLKRAISPASSCTLVFEHTPQYTDDWAFIGEGIAWVKAVVGDF